jgi:hypothetical protein
VIYWRRYVERFQLDTQDLTNTELGVYDRLLDYYFGKEQPIPFGRAESIARAITSADRKALKLVLGQFFARESDGWHNKRADHEIAMAKKARANGIKGDPDYPPDAPPDRPPDSSPEAPPEVGADTPPGMGQPVKPLSLSTTKPPTHLTKGVTGGASPTPTKGAAAWSSYREAYKQRYSVEPVRNARANAILSQLVDRLGAQEAPAVATWYVEHGRALYVTLKHPLGLLLQDCEGLRTEWARGQRVTETEGRQSDRTAAIGNAFAPLIAEAKAHE